MRAADVTLCKILNKQEIKPHKVEDGSATQVIDNGSVPPGCDGFRAGSPAIQAREHDRTKAKAPSSARRTAKCAPAQCAGHGRILVQIPPMTLKYVEHSEIHLSRASS
jgi:hypothetical protein